VITSVPNVSEGRDPAVLTAMHAALADHCTVLHADSGADANRTVFTLADGDLVAATLALGRVARDRCDLRVHRGIHVRMGAIDVVPFVPNAPPGGARDGELAWCRDLAEEAGRRFAAELALPVWRYGLDSRALRSVRREGFEVLASTLAEVPPDFGPARPHPTAGAVAVGVRFPLVAFNVCLATREVAEARRVARLVRASAGGLPGVMAIGWYTPSFGCAQVSMNLTAWWETPPHVVYERIRALTPVAGSELVGMIPRGALTAAADFYGTDLDGAADRLGLRYCKPFDPGREVLDEALRRLR
jgi:glutamate formiminotransferase